MQRVRRTPNRYIGLIDAANSFYKASFLSTTPEAIFQEASFYTAFLVGTSSHRPKQRLHITNAPEPPRFWNDLKKHPYGLEFKAAADKEFSDLKRRGTFKIVATEDIRRQFVIPTI